MASPSEPVRRAITQSDAAFGSPKPDGNRRLGAISRFFAWVSGFLIMLSALMVSADVVIRKTLNVSVLNSFELSTYAFAASVTLGHAYALYARSHIRIEVLYALLSQRLRVILDIISIFMLALSALMLAYFAFKTVQFSYRIDAHSNSTLAVPLVVPQGIWFFGLALFALTACWLMVQAVFHLATGQTGKVARNIGVISLHEEISLHSDLTEGQVRGETVRAHNDMHERAD